MRGELRVGQVSPLDHEICDCTQLIPQEKQSNAKSKGTLE